MQSEHKRPGVSVASWMGAQFLFAIPVVNFIALIVIAATSHNRTKRNYCIAALIWSVLLIACAVLSVVFFGPQIVTWCEQLGKTLSAS